jgi:hypothetical protein
MSDHGIVGVAELLNDCATRSPPPTRREWPPSLARRTRPRSSASLPTWHARAPSSPAPSIRYRSGSTARAASAAVTRAPSRCASARGKCWNCLRRFKSEVAYQPGAKILAGRIALPAERERPRRGRARGPRHQTPAENHEHRHAAGDRKKSTNRVLESGLSTKIVRTPLMAIRSSIAAKPRRSVNGALAAKLIMVDDPNCACVVKDRP